MELYARQKERVSKIIGSKSEDGVPIKGLKGEIELLQRLLDKVRKIAAECRIDKVEDDGIDGIIKMFGRVE
jgi:hypothetical protein